MIFELLGHFFVYIAYFAVFQNKYKSRQLEVFAKITKLQEK